MGNPGKLLFQLPFTPFSFHDTFEYLVLKKQRDVFVTVHLAGHCIELSLNPFFSAPTLSTPELTVFARVNLVTVLSSLSRDGIGVPLGSHPPRLLVAFLLLKRRLHTLLYHVRSYCRPRASRDRGVVTNAVWLCFIWRLLPLEVSFYITEVAVTEAN